MMFTKHPVTGGPFAAIDLRVAAFGDDDCFPNSFLGEDRGGCAIAEIMASPPMSPLEGPFHGFDLEESTNNHTFTRESKSTKETPEMDTYDTRKYLASLYRTDEVTGFETEPVQEASAEEEPEPAPAPRRKQGKKRGRKKRSEEDNTPILNVMGMKELDNDTIVANMTKAFAIAQELLHATIGRSWKSEPYGISDEVKPGYMGTSVAQASFDMFVCYIAARLHRNLRSANPANAPCNVIDKKFLPQPFFDRCRDHDMSTSYPVSLKMRFAFQDILPRMMAKVPSQPTSDAGEIDHLLSDSKRPEHPLALLIYQMACACHIMMRENYTFPAGTKNPAVCPLTLRTIAPGDSCTKLLLVRRSSKDYNSKTYPVCVYLHETAEVNLVKSVYTFWTFDKTFRKQLIDWQDGFGAPRSLGAIYYLDQLFNTDAGLAFLAKMFAYLQNLMWIISVSTLRACTVDLMGLDVLGDSPMATPSSEPLETPPPSPRGLEEGTVAGTVAPPTPKKRKRNVPDAAVPGSWDTVEPAAEISHLYYDVDMSEGSLVSLLLALRGAMRTAFGEYAEGLHGGVALLDTTPSKRMEPFKTLEGIRKEYETHVRSAVMGKRVGLKRKRGDDELNPDQLSDALESFANQNVLLDITKLPKDEEGNAPQSGEALMAFTLAFARVALQHRNTSDESVRPGPLAKLDYGSPMAQYICFYTHLLDKIDSRPELMNYFEEKLRNITHPVELVGSLNGLRLTAFAFNLLGDLVDSRTACSHELMGCLPTEGIHSTWLANIKAWMKPSGEETPAFV